MANFIEQLWDSIFTPGPTPTLVIATNVTFACLQVVLFALLLATHSVHFVALSILCGGLWWAINWFANELNIAKAKEEAAEKKRAEQRPVKSATEDSDTEVETPLKRETPKAKSKDVKPAEETGEVRLRGENLSESKSSVSTEDEWEKVSENENEKEK
ncbi:ER protein Pkr1-domain-containing protein [Xylariaceae sp. FL0255]|nr:ER protein Pkr1-domain-containing protein [Xylariaceae sp. FL0255]